MSNFEHRIKEDSTEFEKAFLKIYDGSLWIALEKMKDWQPPREHAIDTDKLSVEKLQEHLLPYKKETVQKLIDEKMQLVTADEFLKLHKESLTAIRENDKLQEQLNTAKKALTEIAEILNNKIHKCDYSCDNFCKFDGSLNMYSVENVQSVIDSSLAAIGGDR